MVEFDASKIFESVMKETKMPEEEAKNVTELVVRRIISSGIKFLSGPHIREIVCSILSENHYEKERKLYTRIGMPLMDYEEILEKVEKGTTKSVINPEKIHHWAADQLAEEYTLLRILTDEESKAHLFGDIYIHQLKYFDLRPYEHNWDSRMILRNGIPPTKLKGFSYKVKAPMNLREALNQIANWTGLIQNEFSGRQTFNYLTIFLAPFAKNLAESEVKNELKSFIYEINHLSTISGKQYLKSSLECYPTITNSFLDEPAIIPHGTIKGVYRDYTSECLKIFNCFTDIFTEGDFYSKPFSYPTHNIFCSIDWLDEFQDSFLHVIDEININQTPYLINSSLNQHNNSIEAIGSENFHNYGILQKLSINLPRIAFLSKDEIKFTEDLSQKLTFCAKILIKKYDIIKKRLDTNHLPLCKSVLDGGTLFQLDKQDLCIGFIGLDEAVKILTHNMMLESSDSLKLGLNIVSEMAKICTELSLNYEKNFTLIEDTSKKAIERFIKLDKRHFPQIVMDSYNNSSKFDENTEVDLFKELQLQARFHSFIAHGATERIHLDILKKQYSSNTDIINFIKRIWLETKIKRLKFLK
ncbi:MAG: anaerobic ribonucleoside-triphosphate reductase [Candidatus Lokiarchaeota archaeon]